MEEGILHTFRTFEQASGSTIQSLELASVLKQVAQISDAEVAALFKAAGLAEGPVKIDDFVRWIFADGDTSRAVSGPEVVFVLGGPGSGKGTFSARIVEKFGYKHLSAGDLLREERQRPGSQLGEMIETCMKDGTIVPAEVTVGLLEQAMRAQGWEGGKYLVDGFPRSLDNAGTWDKMLGQKTNLKFVLVIECSEACMMRRLLHRGQTSGRVDDNEATIRKRFTTFKEQSMPVIEQYRSAGMVRVIDSEPGIDDVWHQVELIFGKK